MRRRDHGGDAGPQRAQHHHAAACRARRPAARPTPGTRRRPARKPSPSSAAVADRDAELAGDLRQQRIAHAQVGRAGERSQRQQGDGARRRVARGASSRRLMGGPGHGDGRRRCTICRGRARRARQFHARACDRVRYAYGRQFVEQPRCAAGPCDATGDAYLQIRPSPSRPWRARSRWKWSRWLMS